MTLTRVISTRTRLVSTRTIRFSHAECVFIRRVAYACEYDTHEFAFYTHESKLRMRVNMTLKIVISPRSSVISTRSVITTRTTVISSRKVCFETYECDYARLIATRRVRFPHAECDFTRRVWFRHTRE
jgi:hypothetical protein